MFHFVFSFPQQTTLKPSLFNGSIWSAKIEKDNTLLRFSGKRRPDIVLMFASTLIIHTYYVFLLFFLHSVDDKR